MQIKNLLRCSLLRLERRKERHTDKRGEHRSLEYVGKRVHIQLDFPLSEIVGSRLRIVVARAKSDPSGGQLGVTFHHG